LILEEPTATRHRKNQNAAASYYTAAAAIQKEKKPKNYTDATNRHPCHLFLKLFLREGKCILNTL